MYSTIKALPWASNYNPALLIPSNVKLSNILQVISCEEPYAMIELSLPVKIYSTTKFSELTDVIPPNT